jgi:glucose/arabinose dehydrogenase
MDTNRCRRAGRVGRLGAWASACVALSLQSLAGARPLPPGFVDTTIPVAFEQATGLAFAADGRMIVWEKSGQVWTVVNGVKDPAPLLDIREEVGDWRDYGLLALALAPDFLTSGHFYVGYVVDYHHAAYFGTPQYNPQANEFFRDTIARVTRYTADPATGFRTIVPGSRHIILGQTLQTGIPICHQSHGIGSLVFGADGTLLITTGDAASYEEADNGGPTSGSSNTALAEGIITPAEDVGAFRAQLVDSHSGKVLRIDPDTGLGVPTNPFYDVDNPAAPRSRVWALGLRNPFRASLRPGTGSDHHRHADPGTLYIGDVGWTTWEEINVARSPGQNFGWPIWEGLGLNWAYPSLITPNITAPNPLAGTGGCAPFFSFQSLLRLDAVWSTWPNPCNSAQQIPASLDRFVHTRPRIDWPHNAGPARVPYYNQFGSPEIHWVVPGGPIPGEVFGGASATGGAWYTGLDFPPEYRNVYFFADFAFGWIRALVMDASDNVIEVRPFATNSHAGAIVAMATSPAQPGLFYINYDELGQARVHRITYVANENLPAVAAAQATPQFGPSPLVVQFSSAGSFDPEGAGLTYQWDFGDGSAPSTQANPVHVYRDETDITALGVIVGRVFELDPPGPIGSGNPNPQIIRDGDRPPVGSDDSARQFDTFHAGAQGTLDWIGYTFSEPRTITQVVFQEGKHFFDGGWFSALNIQCRDTSGVWRTVTGLVSTPPYAGNNGVNFETFSFRFDPFLATGVRLLGAPGGSAGFISVAELRAVATNSPANEPRRFDATLTVCDNAQLCSSASVPVWINNTPPLVQITSPQDGSHYHPGATFLLPLLANIIDAEHNAAQLSCLWRTILHHDEHTHPEPADNNCSTQSLITPHGSPGDTFFWEFELTVTDPLGLSTTVTSTITPVDLCRGDANFDLVVSFSDITTVLANFGTVGPPGDADASGLVNFGDVTTVLAHFGATCP